MKIHACGILEQSKMGIVPNFFKGWGPFPAVLLISCLIPDSQIEGNYSVSRWIVFGLVLLFGLFIILRKRKVPWNCGNATWGIVAAVVFECFYVVKEIIGNTFPETVIGFCGSFENPSGLALTSCLLGVCLYNQFMNVSRNDKRIRLWCLVSLFLCLAMILLSNSRTGLLSLGFVTTFELIRRWKISSVKKGICVIFLLGGICFFVLTHKSDSTQGRLFILGRTWELIEKKPIQGYGPNGFRKTYMTQQAEYFKQHPDSEYALLADEIRHPLNEYALTWVNYGIIGVLVLGGFLLLPFILHSPPVIRNCSAVLIIFCAFSYPLQYPLTWLVMAGMGYSMLNASWKKIIQNISPAWGLSGCAIAAAVWGCFFWIDIKLSSAAQSADHHSHTNAVRKYKKLENCFLLRHDANYWYNYTYELYQYQDFDEAYQKAQQCEQCWNGYNLQLLMGDIAAHRGKDWQDKAISHYCTAAYMCPARFAPLEGLYHAYLTKGDTLQANDVARMVKEKKVKIPSQHINRMRMEIIEY